MLEIKFKLPQVKNFINELSDNSDQFFQKLRINVRENVGNYLSTLMESELSLFLGREKHQRNSDQEANNYRNGYYQRKYTLKGIGQVRVKVPRDRNGEYQSSILPKNKQYEKSIQEDLIYMYLTGISTRSLSMISRKLVGRKLSAQEVSKANKELVEAIEKWRNRDLSHEQIKYMFIDGVNFAMRISGSIEQVPVLVAVGVNQKNQKKVLGFQSGDKESSSSWREFFKDLKARGLKGQGVQLGIMDGLPGLEKVFKQEFPKAKIQRCQVHVVRNVLCKVPKKLKKEVGDDISSIFYASSEKKAYEFYEQFKKKWETELPSAVKCLAKNILHCTTFFSFPEEEWISLRTTNIIERLNKEYKRRTKSMEIVAGENSCYLLLAFISLRMEQHWRSNPVGKVRYNLPNLQNFRKKIYTK